MKLKIPPDVDVNVVNMAAAPNATTPLEFEFEAAESEVISGVAGPMKFVAVIMIVLGILDGLRGMLHLTTVVGVLTAAQGAVMILIGTWLYSAAGSFRQIVVTEGNDVTNLMFALRKLRSVYTLQAWLLGIGCGIAVVMLVMALK